MIKSKKQMFVVIGVFALVMMLGTVTYAFFNYTRTGTANTIRTGRIAFNASQDGNINLTNAFPIDSTQAQTDTTNAKSVSIVVTGDTDYVNGIEYLVTASDVNFTVGSGANAKTLPIALEVSVSSNTHGEEPNQTTTTLGTAETGDYYANRSSYTVSKYKVLYDGELEEDARILVGYIAPNVTPGTSSGIDGTINIKAYIDSSKILISDTYPSGDVDANNDNETDYTNGTPASIAEGKTVFTTTEWNSIQSSPLSFKVKVESNEGIWVPQLATEYVLSNATLETVPYGNVYTGANPNNYVIFNNEQWRIIGVYDNNLKIIKATPLSEKMAYDSGSSYDSGSYIFEGSAIEVYLNQDTNGGYYYSLTDMSKNMIANGTFNTGRVSFNDNALQAYTNSQLSQVMNKKIGLLAVFEYLYAADNSCYNTSGATYSSSCAANDWLKTGSTYWTLSGNNTNGSSLYLGMIVASDGGINHDNASVTAQHYIYPVVYLKTSVIITGGTGESGGNEYTLGYTAS